MHYGVDEFESNVNSDSIQTTNMQGTDEEEFESNVNSDSIQTINENNWSDDTFESNVNSDSIQTFISSIPFLSCLRVM